MIKQLEEELEYKEFNIIKESLMVDLKIERVNYLSEKSDVWDITVPGIGHFSLSNGAVVHNSDAMRYLCVALPKLQAGSSPEEIDKRYNQVFYGSDKLGGFFSDDKTGYY